MKKKVLVLGGGLLQVPLIKLAKQKEFQVFLADYYENPPGKKYCDRSRQISSTSIEDNYKYVSDEKIDYIMTVGTDQPVYVAASVSEALGLPFPINEEQGKMATNKLYMKTAMVEHEIPTAKFRVFSRSEDIDLQNLNFPLVMKPVDSQGQRGIFVLKGTEELDNIRQLFEVSKGYSLSDSVIIEEFCPGDEITVNCWVKDGKAFILLITDRLHFDDSIALGVCQQQRFPSVAASGYEEKIQSISQKIADAFKIKDGPLYIQMVVGREGPVVIEFGYRIGGGFEADVIPLQTGIDILELYFTLVTEQKNNFQPEKIENKFQMGSIFFLIGKPGLIQKICMPDEFKQYNGRLFIKEKQELGQIENATSRIGCFIIYTNNPNEYKELINKFELEMAIYDSNNNDLLVHNIWV